MNADWAQMNAEKAKQGELDRALMLQLARI